MNRTKNNKGFSMVELLVAITLMAVGILAVVQMQVVGLQSGRIANSLSVATGLANEVMEDVQSWDLTNPPVVNLFTPSAPNYTLGNQAYTRFQATRDQANITIPSAGTFTAVYNVTLIQNPGQTDDLQTARITVTVTGGGRSVTITSYRRVV